MKIAMLTVLVIQAVEVGCWMQTYDHEKAAINCIKALIVGGIAVAYLFD